ncbi:unnamed protein product [Pleuronectes platessa]|uniref:Uncharacterized protein n=1 Tax=Pleuronectes platessa TaxID=8262 RepID=A0A9N7U338_PLEPL|nr:unnamed protein product [Pleuronectes platessa]
MKPSFTLLCSDTHCNVNSGALQSDWANGVPSHQATRPTRTCREIVRIKPASPSDTPLYTCGLSFPPTLMTVFVRLMDTRPPPLTSAVCTSPWRKGRVDEGMPKIEFYVQEEEIPVVVYVLANGAHRRVGSSTDCQDSQQSGGGSDIERGSTRLHKACLSSGFPRLLM